MSTEVSRTSDGLGYRSDGDTATAQVSMSARSSSETVQRHRLSLIVNRWHLDSAKVVLRRDRALLPDEWKDYGKDIVTVKGPVEDVLAFLTHYAQVYREHRAGAESVAEHSDEE